MGHSSCCVVNCKNTGRNSSCKFYRFPTASWKREQCEKWIAAVRRKNADGSPWYPKPSDLICSSHFIGGKKADEMASPSYVPTIFPSIYRSKKSNETASISRHKRFMERRKKKELSNTIPTDYPFIYSSDTCHQINKALKRYQVNICSEFNNTGNITEQRRKEELSSTIPMNQPFIYSSETCHKEDKALKRHQECQVDIHSEFNKPGNTFTCNRYIYNQVCDAEIQTEINNSTIYTKTHKKIENNVCYISQKTYTDVATSTEKTDFTISNEKQLIHRSPRPNIKQLSVLLVNRVFAQ